MTRAVRQPPRSEGCRADPAMDNDPGKGGPIGRRCGWNYQAQSGEQGTLAIPDLCVAKDSPSSWSARLDHHCPSHFASHRPGTGTAPRRARSNPPRGLEHPASSQAPKRIPPRFGVFRSRVHGFEIVWIRDCAALRHGLPARCDRQIRIEVVSSRDAVSAANEVAGHKFMHAPRRINPSGTHPCATHRCTR